MVVAVVVCINSKTKLMREKREFNYCIFHVKLEKFSFYISRLLSLEHNIYTLI